MHSTQSPPPSQTLPPSSEHTAPAALSGFTGSPPSHTSSVHSFPSSIGLHPPAPPPPVLVVLVVPLMLVVPPLPVVVVAPPASPPAAVEAPASPPEPPPPLPIVISLPQPRQTATTKVAATHGRRPALPVPNVNASR